MYAQWTVRRLLFFPFRATTRAQVADVLKPPDMEIELSTVTRVIEQARVQRQVVELATAM